MLTNLSFEEEGNTRTVLKIRRAANLTVPYQSKQGLAYHLETRNVCRALEQSGRFEVRNEKRLKGIYFVVCPQRRDEGLFRLLGPIPGARDTVAQS